MSASAALAVCLVLKNYYKTNSQKNWRQKFTTAEQKKKQKNAAELRKQRQNDNKRKARQA